MKMEPLASTALAINVLIIVDVLKLVSKDTSDCRLGKRASRQAHNLEDRQFESGTCY